MSKEDLESSGPKEKQKKVKRKKYGELTFEERLERSKHLKVAITVVPLLGHFIPVSHLGDELQSRGHEVHVITIDYQTENLKKICEQNNLKLHLTCNGLTIDDFMVHSATAER